MSEKDKIRAAKRNREMVHIIGGGDDLCTSWLEPVFRELSGVPSGPHAPMKRESQAIRKAMAETGKTEEELRLDPHYRRIFSEAQKQKGTKTPSQRSAIRLLKRITRELKLPREHPQVREAYQKLASTQGGESFFTRYKEKLPPFDQVLNLLRKAK